MKHLVGCYVAEQLSKWHVPRWQFRNLLFDEYIFADTFFVLHCQYGKPAYLDRFLTVYCPACCDVSPERQDCNGDMR
jgi:hypothetical protein